MPRGAPMWAGVIGAGLAVEAYGLFRGPGYTASETLRWIFATHHPHGRRLFTATVVSGAGILIPHIINKTDLDPGPPTATIGL